MSDKERGLYAKYRVYRINEAGRSQDEVTDPVFVLNPRTDPIARLALHHYADEARRRGYDLLANDLREMVKRGTVDAYKDSE